MTTTSRHAFVAHVDVSGCIEARDVRTRLLAVGSDTTCRLNLEYVLIPKLQQRPPAAHAKDATRRFAAMPN